jgi:hypothetical protein
MACILKPPHGDAPGVVTFTTPERDRVIRPRPELSAQLMALKHRWVIGLHHNWHDFRFRRGDVFDFNLAGETDLRTRLGRRIKVLDLDACNFCPSDLRPARAEKFWDLLFVAHPTYLKRYPVLFQAIRSLYDGGHDLRVLAICPMAPYDPSEAATFMFDVRDIYESMFSASEQDNFTLLTLDFRYPFPLDLPTLAHFYRSSRMLIHTPADERRCRVAAYAWAAGLPVIARASVGSLLPRELRRSPFFYEVGPDDDYAGAVEHALSEYDPGADFGPVRAVTSVDETPPLLDQRLAEVFTQRGRLVNTAPLTIQAADIRLGRHHGFGDHPGTVPQVLGDFLRYLEERPEEELADDLQQPDPERFVAALPVYKSRPELLFTPDAPVPDGIWQLVANQVAGWLGRAGARA